MASIEKLNFKPNLKDSIGSYVISENFCVFAFHRMIVVALLCRYDLRQSVKFKVKQFDFLLDCLGRAVYTLINKTATEESFTSTNGQVTFTILKEPKVHFEFRAEEDK